MYYEQIMKMAETMPLRFVDWGMKTGVRSREPGWPLGKTLVSRNLSAFLNMLNKPTIIVLESTVASFRPEERKDFLERCAREGHSVQMLPPRLTARNSRRFGIEKSDDNDPYIFHRMILDGVETREPHAPDTAVQGKSTEANALLRWMRCNGVWQPMKRAEREEWLSYKELWAQRLAAALPPVSTLTLTQQQVYCDKDHKSYSLPTLAACGMAALFSSGQREFDHIAGLYSHAYPTQIRADLHHHNWAGGNSRQRLHGKGTGARVDGLTLSQWRRELRCLGHMLRPLVQELDPRKYQE